LSLSANLASRLHDDHAVADAPNGGDAWYAVWTHSHCERLVAEHMSAKRFQCFLPEMNVWSKRIGTPARLARVPMFPGYFFVRHAMDKASYVEILKVRGIVRILEGGWKQLTPIPDTEITALQQLFHANVPIFAHQHLRHGDHVRVIDGPMTDLEGIFVQDRPNKGRLVLSVNLLGRSVAVEIDGMSVTRCASAGRH
jgi:transcription antitermination factor NusG